MSEEEEEEKNAMEVIAEAAYYIPELVQGMEGTFEIDGMYTPKESVAEIHEVQLALAQAGWRRDKEREQYAPFSHNIEVACYRKQLKRGQRSRWVYITIATRFGLIAKFYGGQKLPW